MKPYLIYLAGPITGCTYAGYTDWRDAFVTHMPDNVQCLSPMRGKDYLLQETRIGDAYDNTVLSCSRGIMTRDFFDCTRSDLIVAYLVGADRVSIGTVMEIAWGYRTGKPVIVVMEKSGNLHDHSMIREATGFRVQTLEEAATTALITLFPPGLK